MKKTSSLLKSFGFAIAIGLMATGCGGNSPSKVVRQTWAAIEKGDAKAYGELMTPETASLVVMLGEKAKGSVAAKGGIVSTKETINGDAATVTATYKDGTTDEWQLVKVDGKWKVKMEGGK
jgi:ketosteroid isomerase-like protein